RRLSSLSAQRAIRGFSRHHRPRVVDEARRLDVRLPPSRRPVRRREKVAALGWRASGQRRVEAAGCAWRGALPDPMNIMDIAVVFVAWCGVWIFGVSLVTAVRAPFVWDAPGEAAWTKGIGFFVGAFALTVWMRALSAVHIPFGIATIVLPLA